MKKSLLALMLGLVGCAVLVAWLVTTGTGAGSPSEARPSAPAAVPAVSARSELAEPTPAAKDDAPALATARETVIEGDAAARRRDELLANAQWIEVELVLPPAIPADEQIELIAVGFALDRFATDDDSSAGYSNYKQRIENGGWGRVWMANADAPQPDEFVCERVSPSRYRAPFPRGSTVGVLRLDARYVFATDIPKVVLPIERVSIEARLGAWFTGRLKLPSNLPADLDPSAIERFDVTLNGWKMGPGNESYGEVIAIGPELAFEFGGLRPGLTYFVNGSPKEFVGFGEMNLGAEAGQHIDREYTLSLGARVRGRVLDGSGDPVPDATVTAASETRRMFDFGGGRTDTAGADGSFELRGVAAGKVELSAGGEGFVSEGKQELELADGQVVEGLELRLNLGKTIAGRVIWPDGAAAAGAEVEVNETLPKNDRRRWMREFKHTAKAGDDGRFFVSGLEVERVEVRAKLERAQDDGGSQIWTARNENATTGSEITLALAPPHEVRGRAIDDLGQPVATFTVTAAEASDTDEFDNQRVTKPFASADGAFTLSLAAGTYDVNAEAPGHAASEKQRVTLPGGSGDLTLTLPRAASVAGVVLDPTGKPVASAGVDVETGDRAQRFARNQAQHKTDAQGRFQIDDVEPGSVKLTARSDDFAPSAPLTIPVVPGVPSEDLVLTLRIGGRLEGEIYDAQGAPDAGRQIMVGSFAMNSGELGGSATSDSAGLFVVDHLAPGTYNVIATPRMDQLDENSAEDPAAMMASMKMTSVEIRDGETAHVVLGAPPKAPVHVSGRVTQAGEPFRNGVVMAIAEGKSMLDSLKMGQLDGDGRYALTLDAPGDYTFIVSAQMGDNNAVEFPETVPEVSEHVLDLVLPLGGIRGRVVARDGKPLADVPVTLEIEGRGSIFVVDMGRNVSTDGDGGFEFKNLKSATYTVRAGAGTFDSFRGDAPHHAVALRTGLVVEADRMLEGVEIRLASPGKIAGTVRDGNGEPVASAAVFVRDSQGRMLNPMSSCVSDGLGKFEYDSAGPGTYTLSARSGTLTSRDGAPVRVVEGETSTVELRLEPGTILRVSVEDENGQTVRASLSVLDDEGREVGGLLGADAMQRLFTEGYSTTEQRLGPLPPGKYRVTATANDGTKVTRPVTLTGQEERTVRIRLKD